MCNRQNADSSIKLQDKLLVRRDYLGSIVNFISHSKS